MKPYILCALIFIAPCSFAQFHLPVLNNEVNNALVKVIEDYPDHFNAIRGTIINEDVQVINYSSTVNITGADSSIIIQNGELNDNIYSWKENIFETEDPQKARAKFHEYYKQIKGTAVTVDNSRTVFNADYIEPDDTKQFTSILFIAHPQTQELKDVVIDLALHYLMDKWQISVSIYEHTDYGLHDSN